jgi:hypothetical protein
MNCDKHVTYARQFAIALVVRNTVNLYVMYAALSDEQGIRTFDKMEMILETVRAIEGSPRTSETLTLEGLRAIDFTLSAKILYIRHACQLER